MRRTIHLVQRGIPVASQACLACGEKSLVLKTEAAQRGRPALCVNYDLWDTVYVNNAKYRRCIDTPDERDKPSSYARCATPSEPGFYWAEWRIAEDGTWPPGNEHIMSFTPEVVAVRRKMNDLDDQSLIVDVPGFNVEQDLENFVWRSERLSPPGAK